MKPFARDIEFIQLSYFMVLSYYFAAPLCERALPYGDRFIVKALLATWSSQMAMWPPLFLKHCGIGHLKTRLLPDLKPSQNVPKHSFFKLCKFHEKING